MTENISLIKTKAPVSTSVLAVSFQESRVHPTTSHPSKSQFSVRISLRDTAEEFVVPKCRYSMKIRELKSVLELIAGIPADFQRLCYLDQGVLMDESTFRYNQIVPGTTITLMIWPYDNWPELVKASVTGDIHTLQSVVSKPAPPCSSQSRGGISLSATRLSHRLFSALFVTAHRGHTPAVCFLLQNGADVKAHTPLGRGALHAAAAQSHTQCIQELLAEGASLHQQDNEGMTALHVAKRLGQKKSVRQLFLFDWQERAAGVRTKPHLLKSELFAHQCFDSHLKTWHRGPEAQQYMATLQRRGKFQGTSLRPPQNRDV